MASCVGYAAVHPFSWHRGAGELLARQVDHSETAEEMSPKLADAPSCSAHRAEGTVGGAGRVMAPPRQYSAAALAPSICSASQSFIEAGGGLAAVFISADMLPPRRISSHRGCGEEANPRILESGARHPGSISVAWHADTASRAAVARTARGGRRMDKFYEMRLPSICVAAAANSTNNRAFESPRGIGDVIPTHTQRGSIYLSAQSD